MGVSSGWLTVLDGGPCGSCVIVLPSLFLLVFLLGRKVGGFPRGGNDGVYMCTSHHVRVFLTHC